MNLAFYAYFYGSEENVAFKIPELPSLKYKCYYYTNNKTMLEKLKETNWIGVFDDKPTIDDVIESNMVGKYIKSCPHKYDELKNYDYLCYMDSKLGMVNELLVEEFIQKCFIEQNYALILKKHWYIENHVWNEFAECFDKYRYRLQSNQIINYIVNQKRKGLSEITEKHCACSFLIRNMKHEKINELNETWYQHIQECGIQDQISFFFVKQLFKEHIFVFDKEELYYWR
jgi:hypothetical protein